MSEIFHFGPNGPVAGPDTNRGSYRSLATFSDPALAGNSHVRVIPPEHGGHCAFVSRHPGAERFWAEARIMDFFSALRAFQPREPRSLPQAASLG